MPIGTLYVEFVKRINNIVDKRAGAAIAQKAPVDSVSEDGTLVARVDGSVVRASLATEEPIIAGETAWISKTKDGQYIAHGSAH